MSFGISECFLGKIQERRKSNEIAPDDSCDLTGATQNAGVGVCRQHVSPEPELQT